MAGQLRLALDQNFPVPAVRSVAGFLPPSIDLAPLQSIDPRLTGLDDRPLIIALSQLGWDGLVTNNYKMLYEPHEVSALVETKLTLIAIHGRGHDPLRAAGIMLLELPGIEHRLIANNSSVFLLREKPHVPERAWSYLNRAAERHKQDAETLWRDNRPSAAELSQPVLATDA